MDSKASIKISLELYWKKYKTNMYINYTPSEDGVDDRVSEWFNECHNDAYTGYCAEIYDMRKSQERGKKIEDAKNLLKQEWIID